MFHWSRDWLSLRSVLLSISLFWWIGSVSSAELRVSFSSSELLGTENLVSPTSLQFGPDGRLYVSQRDGTIHVFTIQQDGADYEVTNTETIDLVKRIPNYNDDGTPSDRSERLVTGLLVSGTASNPVLYVSSSDSLVGIAEDSNLCTNSGIISRLTHKGDNWEKVDLVRGLPRSESNHATNGMQLDEKNQVLYVASGGFTNAGAPSRKFAFICEYALSAAILSMDLKAIDAMSLKGEDTEHPYKYDLPTLDDPTRPNRSDGSDEGDPFGGNDGLNQAKIVLDGPVQVYASGFRNAYDLLITRTEGREGNLYTIDNGANPGWGGYPDNEGPEGKVTNRYLSDEPGSTGPGPNDPRVNNRNGFHFIGNLEEYKSGSYYGGHPNPIRANPSGAGLYTHSGSKPKGEGVWRSNRTDSRYPLPADWPPVPVEMANAAEGDFQNPGETDPSLITFREASTGLTEYTSSALDGQMKGDILIASLPGMIQRVRLTEDGSGVRNKMRNDHLNQDPPFAKGLTGRPIDIVAQGDEDPFPGTVWMALFEGNAIVVFQPQSLECSGTRSQDDEDRDGYANSDELDNETDPCSGASRPEDYDRDLVSDVNDPDDDNDEIPDMKDHFVLDSKNGMTTGIPVHYSLDPGEPAPGFFGTGFTGLMTDGRTDYLDLMDESDLITGGAVGVFTIANVTEGDALGQANSQRNAFQFGLNVTRDTPPFFVRTRLLGPFFGGNLPDGYMSHGFFIGTGDQDNYVKIALAVLEKQIVIEVVHEEEGKVRKKTYHLKESSDTSLDLYLYINPARGVVQPKYSLEEHKVLSLGPEISVNGDLLNSLLGDPALAVGIIATSQRSKEAFHATWDFIEAGFE